MRENMFKYLFIPWSSKNSPSRFSEGGIFPIAPNYLQSACSLLAVRISLFIAKVAPRPSKFSSLGRTFHISLQRQEVNHILIFFFRCATANPDIVRNPSAFLLKSIFKYATAALFDLVEKQGRIVSQNVIQINNQR